MYVIIARPILILSKLERDAHVAKYDDGDIESRRIHSIVRFTRDKETLTDGEQTGRCLYDDGVSAIFLRIVDCSFLLLYVLVSPFLGSIN